ncbi:MAG: hypothetical protein EBW42_02150, partial [Rhodobacterales bacterium]|nr:hypothetical protein [Rhodobacterales bacterium]
KGENISTKEAKSKLYSAVENVTNPMFQKEAKTFVGSNTEFLAPTFNPEGSIHRGSSLDNKFFTRYTDNPQTGLMRKYEPCLTYSTVRSNYFKLR